MTTPKIPPYLNEELILEALDPTGADKLAIKSFNIERNTLGGNYCSDIYCAKVEYRANNHVEDENCENEVKLANLLIKDLFLSVASSSQEHFTYVSLLPLIEEILKKAGVETPALSPK